MSTTPLPETVTPPLPPGLLEEVRAAAPAAPTRQALNRRRAALAVACVGVSALVFFLFGGLRGGGAPRPPVLIVATTLGSAVITALAWWAGWSRRSMTARRFGVVLAAIGLTPLALFAWKVGWSAGFPGGLARWPERIGIPCFEISLLTGVGPLAAWLWLRAQSEPRHPAWAGALLGVVAGGWGWFVTDLWCPVGHPTHLMLGHVLPLLVLGGLGAVFGARVLAIRWTPRAR